MRRLLSVFAGAMVAVLLLSSDASACHRRSAGCSAAPACNSCGSYGTANGGVAYGGAAYGGTAYGGAAYNNGGYDFGRPGYNPGGLGGPASGLGVRPGAGFGGFGLRR